MTKISPPFTIMVKKLRNVAHCLRTRKIINRYRISAKIILKIMDLH